MVPSSAIDLLKIITFQLHRFLLKEVNLFYNTNILFGDLQSVSTGLVYDLNYGLSQVG